MKQILFIGEYDKTDMMFYLGKLISLEHKVLIVDATKTHRYEHSYPKVSMEMGSHIHQHEHFDVIENITNYTQFQDVVVGQHYDYALVDIDSKECLKEWPAAEQYFLITSYENPVIQRNLELVQALVQTKLVSDSIPITKVICEINVAINEEYINTLFEDLGIDWGESLVYYTDERDLTIKINNQLKSTISINKLSGEYKKVLKQIVALILESNLSATNALWKQAERSK